MEHTMIPEPPGFSELPKAEQVRYLQALWDRISERPEEVPVPESHLELAQDRLSRHRQGPGQARPPFDVRERLAKKSK